MACPWAHRWDRERGVCEVGYDLQEAHRGQGCMTEAMEAILSFARRSMQVRRVVACIYGGNEASIRLARRLGFLPGGGYGWNTSGGRRFHTNCMCWIFRRGTKLKGADHRSAPFCFPQDTKMLRNHNPPGS